MERLDDFLKTVKEQEIVNLAKANEIIGNIKAADFLKKKEEEKTRKTNTIAIIVGIVAGVAIVAAIAYGLYCYFTPDYLDDFEDDFEDDFDDDFEDDFFEGEEADK